MCAAKSPIISKARFIPLASFKQPHNEIGWYAYADKGDGERREKGIGRNVCHPKYGLVCTLSGDILFS